MKKEKYASAKIELILLKTDDIIRTSGDYDEGENNNNGGGNGGGGNALMPKPFGVDII